MYQQFLTFHRMKPADSYTPEATSLLQQQIFGEVDPDEFEEEIAKGDDL